MQTVFVAETLNELIHNTAHWQFEGIGMFIDNVLIGLLLIPLSRRWLKKRDARKSAHKHCDDVHPRTITIPVEVISGIRYVRVDDLDLEISVR
jgi:hypothetical protein